MDPVLVFVAIVPGVPEASSKEVLVDAAVYIEHLVEEKYIVAETVIKWSSIRRVQ